MYLKREFGINSIDLKEDLKVFPHGISIPEISSVFNQIRNFKGNKYSTKLFFKSKIDELAAIIIQKADVFRGLNASVSVADRNAIIEITEYLNQNLSKNFSLMELSADAYMSISKFKYVFKAVIGQSISEYMTQKRNVPVKCYHIVIYILQRLLILLDIKMQEVFLLNLKNIWGYSQMITDWAESICM